MIPMKQADIVTAVVLAAVGLAMLAGGFTMERLEVRRIHPASIPGLLPMILGVLLFICAVMLYRGARAELKDEVIELGDPLRLLGTGALCLIYAVGLIGRVPFHIATFVFIAGFVALFTWKGGSDRIRTLRWIVIAPVTGAIASAAISSLFQYGFLVRLP